MTPGAPEGTALGFLVVHDGGPERQVPIYDQLFVGRECAGIGEARRLVIDDPEMSRTHLEIRLDAANNQAFVIDTSTNGTLLNGIRLERAVPRPIKPGDEIRIGDIALTFRSQLFAAAKQAVRPPSRADPHAHQPGRHGHGGRRHHQLLHDVAGDRRTGDRPRPAHAVA